MRLRGFIIRKIVITLAALTCIIAALALLYMSDASGSGDGMAAAGTYVDPAVPADAQRVGSQADVDRLLPGANAVLAADVDVLNLTASISLFGNGRSVGMVTLAAPGARVSGVTAGAIVVGADNCTVDHCTVKAQGMTAISVDGVDDARVLANTVLGLQVTDSNGIFVENADRAIVAGNRVSGAYMSIFVRDCASPLVSDNYVGHVAGFRQGIDLYGEAITGGAFRGNEVEFDPYHGTGAAQDHDAIGFRELDGVLIADNRAAGHYYTLKVYTSKNCVIENNTLTRAGSLRTGFYDSNLVVRGNKISGEPLVGLSIGIWINDGTVDSLYEGNEIWDCQYGVQESHYPEGYAYLEGNPSLPCSNITLKNNYIHDCSGAYLHIMDKGSVTEVGNNYGPTPAPSSTVAASPTAVPSGTATTGPSITPTPKPTATETTQSSGGLLDGIFDFLKSIYHRIFP